MIRKRIFAAFAAAALVTAGAVTAAVTGTGEPAAVRPTAAAVPAFDHIVLVMFENKKYSSINGSSSAPYFNTLASQSAKFTNSFAITHPSQPNYVALFSGATQGVTDDSCPANLGAKANLGRQLIDAGKTFKGYSEAMPSDGYTGCSSGTYRRKHNSWVDFSNVPAASNVRFSGFPSDFTQLPTVAFVTPDMCNDMHDCSIGTGDTWLKKNLDAYAQWAKTHNSLLITTFDEDSNTSVNQIFTTFTGANVKVGSYSETINHYTVLRTIEAAYGLPGIGNAASKSPILDVWQ
ncbi:MULTISPECIES: alkaline phosphatase family protein [unclassified Amycolatopsis]|uniref:alkaline phosphatase family protein n=1 Tax=unclassified Amycolatopsis TaxID=2618356 RepID=UPI00287484D7|nr:MULTISPECIES: alkaline phosphatase family protein [unclassified Amycolatopsis]MDS0135629.1 acid phosphatase [Amycolatopsis sp. 505]MDS0148355.1 acid phosphatase [Amycolatopsis sp. CM201R]